MRRPEGSATDLQAAIGHYGTLESVPEPASTLTLLGGALVAFGSCVGN